MLKLTFVSNISHSFIPVVVTNQSLKCNIFDSKRVTVKLQINGLHNDKEVPPCSVLKSEKKSTKISVNANKTNYFVSFPFTYFVKLRNSLNLLRRAGTYPLAASYVAHLQTGSRLAHVRHQRMSPNFYRV